MKKYFYMAVAAIAVLSSCNKTDALLDDNGNGVDNTNAPVFTATIESDATKTTLVEGSTAGKLTKVAWLNTDQVYIDGVDVNAALSNLSIIGNYNVTPNAEDPSSATLTPGSLRYNNPEVVCNQIMAIYPASISCVNVENLDVETMYANKFQKLQLLKKRNMIVLPSTQKYNGTDISQIAPMYGKMEPGSDAIYFKNLTAILAITVPATECTSVKEIVVSSNQQMCGQYTVSPDDLVMTVVEGTTEIKSLTLDCTDKNYKATTIASDESKTFYVSIPDNTYEYIKIDINKDGVNHYVMQTKAASITVERNKIYPITFAHTDTYGHDEVEDEL